MKYCLVFTMPSGSKWALGPDPQNKNSGSGLALYPIDQNKDTRFKGVFGFENEVDALEWIAESAKMSSQGAIMMATTKPVLCHVIQ